MVVKSWWPLEILQIDLRSFIVLAAVTTFTHIHRTLNPIHNNNYDVV